MSSQTVITEFDTTHLATAQRTPAWEDFNAQHLVRLECRTLEQGGIEAYQRNVRHQTFSAIEISSGPHAIRRDAEMTAQTPAGAVQATVVEEGSCQIWTRDGVDIAHPGQLVLIDTDQPYELIVPDYVRVRLLLAEKSALLSALSPGLPATFDGAAPLDRPALPSQPARLPFPAGLGVASTQREAMYVRSYAESLVRSPQRADGTERALRAFQSLISSALPVDYVTEARNYIALRCQEPRLSAERIAAHIGISVRHLHRCFSAQDSSVGGEVLKARLAFAAQLLQGAGQSQLAISEVAAQAGLASTSHFHRSFTKAYGMTPGQWRAAG